MMFWPSACGAVALGLLGLLFRKAMTRRVRRLVLGPRLPRLENALSDLDARVGNLLVTWAQRPRKEQRELDDLGTQSLRLQRRLDQTWRRSALQPIDDELVLLEVAYARLYGIRQVVPDPELDEEHDDIVDDDHGADGKRRDDGEGGEPAPVAA